MATTKSSTKKNQPVTSPPRGLMNEIKWNLANCPLHPNADRHTRNNHAFLRAEYGMNPDQSKPGFERSLS